MPHNVNKANAEKDFKKASELISSMRADADKIKVQIAEAHKRKRDNNIQIFLKQLWKYFFSVDRSWDD